MKKVNYFLFAGVVILVLYTFFAVQNRISVPVRLTFGEPKVYFLPLIVLSSFIGGAIFCSIFIFIYRIVKILNNTIFFQRICVHIDEF